MVHHMFHLFDGATMLLNLLNVPFKPAEIMEPGLII
jgi:hypothetical protein